MVWDVTTKVITKAAVAGSATAHLVTTCTSDDGCLISDPPASAVWDPLYPAGRSDPGDCYGDNCLAGTKYFNIN